MAFYAQDSEATLSKTTLRRAPFFVSDATRKRSGEKRKLGPSAALQKKGLELCSVRQLVCGYRIELVGPGQEPVSGNAEGVEEGGLPRP